MESCQVFMCDYPDTVLLALESSFPEGKL